VLELLGYLCRERVEVSRVLERWAPSWLAQISAVADAEALRGRLPSPTRESMLRELADAMELLTRKSPMVLVLEDLHWSDASTLDLVTYLAERSTPASLLIVATYRPVEAVIRGGGLRRAIRDLIARGRAAEYALEPLTPRDVQRYVEQLFAGAAVDPDLAATMYAKSEGNPLLLIEIVEHLLEREILAVVDGQWCLTAGHESLPRSVRELVARDVEALADEDQRILAAASAVGNDFEAISVAAASGLAQNAVEDRCARLAEGQQLIRTTGMTSWPDGALGGTYRFRHAVHRDAIYRRLAPTERARLHRAVGGRLEGGWTQGPAAVAAVLASHFEQGGDWQRAVRHHVAAMTAAKGRLADPEVAVHGEAVLRLLERLPASSNRDAIEMRCALDLGSALLAVRGYGTPEVPALFARARDLAIALDQPVMEVAARAGLFTAEAAGGSQLKALLVATELLAMTERVALPLARVVGHASVGTSHYHLGNLADARTHLVHARAALESYGAGPRRDESVLLLGLGALVLQDLGEKAEGDTWLEALIGCVERLEPQNLAGACDLIARYRTGAGDRSDGGRWAERALQLAVEHSFPDMEAMARIQKGYALGDLALQREGFAVLHASGCRMYVPMHRLQMAETLIAAKRWDDARAEVEHAFAAMAETGEARSLAEAHRLRARCLRAARRRSEATTELHQAIAVARRQHARQFERRARADLDSRG
jgi:tetratricopeptide (TPR) repeat protein